MAPRPARKGGRQNRVGAAVALSSLGDADAIGDHVVMVGAASASPNSTAVGNAKQKHYGLRPFVMSTTVFAILLLPVLAVYYAIVFLNFTFVFEPEITLADVPYYVVPHPDSTATWKLADRYGVWWILTALSLLRIGSIVGSHMALANAAITGREFSLSFMRIWLMFYGAADFAIAIFYIITAYSKMCSQVPMCRDWSASLTAIDVDANWVFLLHTWFSLAFAAVHIAYYVCLGKANKRLDQSLNTTLVTEEMKEP